MNRWYPHRDYAGEPMNVGAFRDPQPDDPYEIALRNAAIIAIERFCEAEGHAVPSLNEEIEAPADTILRTTFTGEAPNGRRFGIGYEMRVKP